MWFAPARPPENPQSSAQPVPASLKLLVLHDEPGILDNHHVRKAWHVIFIPAYHQTNNGLHQGSTKTTCAHQQVRKNERLAVQTSLRSSSLSLFVSRSVILSKISLSDTCRTVLPSSSHVCSHDERESQGDFCRPVC
jgi:hypothetical protein